MLPAPPPSSRGLPPTDPTLTVDTLRGIGLFGALNDDILGHLAASLKSRRLAPGEVLFREGDPEARELFVVLSGEVEVLKQCRSGRDIRFALLGPGDCVGEMSVIDMQPRSATARAVAPTRVLRLGAEEMDGLYRRDLKAYALVVLNLARELSRRLRVSDAIVADVASRVLEGVVPRSGKSSS